VGEVLIFLGGRLKEFVHDRLEVICSFLLEEFIIVIIHLLNDFYHTLDVCFIIEDRFVSFILLILYYIASYKLIEAVDEDVFGEEPDIEKLAHKHAHPYQLLFIELFFLRPLSFAD
jgi:hypothetical protein